MKSFYDNAISETRKPCKVKSITGSADAAENQPVTSKMDDYSKPTRRQCRRTRPNNIVRIHLIKEANRQYRQGNKISNAIQR